MTTPFTENQKKVAEKLVENGVIEKAQPGFKIRDSDAFHKESEKGAEKLAENGIAQNSATIIKKS